MKNLPQFNWGERMTFDFPWFPFVLSSFCRKRDLLQRVLWTIISKKWLLPKRRRHQANWVEDRYWEQGRSKKKKTINQLRKNQSGSVDCELSFFFLEFSSRKYKKHCKFTFHRISCLFRSRTSQTWSRVWFFSGTHRLALNGQKRLQALWVFVVLVEGNKRVAQGKKANKLRSLKDRFDHSSNKGAAI